MSDFDQRAVDTYLEATHAVGDHLLRVFDGICRQLELAYFLTSGTLLGAVRSGGWIPWDDDVDVIMFRDDYDRLAARIEPLVPDDMTFSSPQSRSDHITTIPRLFYRHSDRIHVGRMRERPPIETLHIPLDIFVLDRAPRGARLRRVWSALARALDLAAVARYSTLRDVIAEPSTRAPRKVLEAAAVVGSRLLTLNAWHRLRTWLVTAPARRGGTGPFVATNYSTPAGRAMCFEEEWYLPSSTVRFGDADYPAPGDTTAVLTELYGPRFLEPPDVSDRAPIHLRGGLSARLGDQEWAIRNEPDDGAESEKPSASALSGSTSFRRQVIWSLIARVSAAILQILILVLLARGLDPTMFALIATVNVALQVTVAVNGFGLLRKIEYTRSVDRHDPSLPSLFALRLRFSYASSILWVVACLATYAVTDKDGFLALLPAAFWLLIEQTTQIWNGMSVVDGRAQELLPSYFSRRFPVVLFLAAALVFDLSVIWSWTLGLAAGSFLSYAQGYRRQERFARLLWPGRGTVQGRIPLDIGYWWGMVGLQLRDLDVAAVSSLNTVAAGFYAFPARLVSPMNLATLATASAAFPRVARNGLTRRQLRQTLSIGLVPVCLIAGTTALCAPLLPVILGSAYEGSVPVLRITCITAVLSGAASLSAILLQALSTRDAQLTGYLSIGFAVLQVAAAAVAAHVGDAQTVAAAVAGVSALTAGTVWALAHHRVTS